MWLFVEPELALLVPWDGVGVAKTGIGVPKPGIGFSKPGIGVSKPVIEVSKPAIGIARAGIVIYSFLPREVRRARHLLCIFRPVAPVFRPSSPRAASETRVSIYVKQAPQKCFNLSAHCSFVLIIKEKLAERFDFQTFQYVSAAKADHKQKSLPAPLAPPRLEGYEGLKNQTF